MALEIATHIADLVATNPTATDNVSQGDDHIRLVKSTLQATFNSFVGATTTITEAQLTTLGTLVAGMFAPAYHSSYKATEVVTRSTFSTPGTWAEDATAGMTSYNAGLGLLTIATTGVYLVRLGMNIDFNFTDTFSFGLSINGADPAGRWLQAHALSGSAELATFSMQGLYSATAADTLEFQTKVVTQTATVDHMELSVIRVA